MNSKPACLTQNIAKRRLLNYFKIQKDDTIQLSEHFSH